MTKNFNNLSTSEKVLISAGAAAAAGITGLALYILDRRHKGENGPVFVEGISKEDAKFIGAIPARAGDTYLRSAVDAIINVLPGRKSGDESDNAPEEDD